MTTDGKVEIVENEMTKLSISCLGLSKVRWTGKGHFVTDNGSTIIYSDSERKHEAGVEMILDKQTSVSMLGYNPISERLLTVLLAAKPWNVTLIQVYAPTNQATDQEKNGFYTSLQQVYSQAPKQDIVLVGGDFNAKIGEEAPVGKFGLGVRNDNGERLVEFAQATGLLATNAMVRQRPRHQYAWCAPGGACRNQID